jgi:hypothetical protein
VDLFLRDSSAISGRYRAVRGCDIFGATFSDARLDSNGPMVQLPRAPRVGWAWPHDRFKHGIERHGSAAALVDQFSYERRIATRWSLDYGREHDCHDRNNKGPRRTATFVEILRIGSTKFSALLDFGRRRERTRGTLPVNLGGARRELRWRW